jgi:hypothetical protein
MGVEEIEQGLAKWDNFQEYYFIFHDDPSLMNSLAKEVGDGRPVAGAGIKSSTGGIYSQCFLASFFISLQLLTMRMRHARTPGGKRAGLFDGFDVDSYEASSEQSTGVATKKAKTPKTPGASRLSKPDHSFSQLMHRLEEMERHQTAADAREVRHSAAIQAKSCACHRR